MRAVWEVFIVCLRLGCTSFGGPIAHLGYFRTEFVVRRGWVTDAAYAECVALCQVLPGPTSSQVGFAIGRYRAGVAGGAAAWVGFTLPSALLLGALALGVMTSEGDLSDPSLERAREGAIRGVLAVAVAVIALAVRGMAVALAPDLARALIAILCGTLVLVWGSPGASLGAVVIGAIAGLVWLRGSTDATEAVSGSPLAAPPRRAVGAAIALVVLLGTLPLLAVLTRDPTVQLLDAITRAGATVFGGGHVVLAMLYSEPAVGQSIAQDHLLLGYGAAQAVPGPMFTLATYLGMVFEPDAAWGARIALAGAATIAIFLPGMLLVTAVAPVWSRMLRSPRARGALGGINAAVVGVLAAAWFDPVLVHGVDGLQTVILAGASVAALHARVPPWGVVLGGALSGALGWLG
ncbi:chromate efflux transporter [Leucobacter musarum]|uniref:chromate efflux transporter n=1 Tax=Leucobacter musarum TaxID=1930747 RepID=UPI0009494EC3|nr:chromate efflux transporter [Leucobacter musarum]